MATLRENDSLGHSKNCVQVLVLLQKGLPGRSAFVRVTEVKRWCVIASVLRNRSFRLRSFRLRSQRPAPFPTPWTTRSLPPQKRETVRF